MREKQVTQATTITSSTSEVTIGTAPGAGQRLNLTSLVIANTSATVTTVTIRDATAGGTVRKFRVPANDTRGIAGCDWQQGSQNANWTAQCADSVASIEIAATFDQVV